MGTHPIFESDFDCLTDMSLITIGAAASGFISASLMLLETYQCTTFECCNDRWVVQNSTLLKEQLNTRLYGQPFATRILTKTIVNHWSEARPPLPLVLMLHGPTGTGKNHISRLLAESMFTAELDSRFINYYSSTRHFKETNKVHEYGTTLQHEIESNLTVCDRQLFIFDEARRYPPKLLDSLAQYFDQGSPQSSKAARSVFMFIYEGDEPVVEWAIELNQAGVNREDITLRQAEERLIPYVMADKSLQESTLVRNGLIQHHLPFLPLEQLHVRQCIRDAILDLHTALHATVLAQSGLIDKMFCSTLDRLGQTGLDWVRHYTPGVEARHYVKCVMVRG